jgi:hypothetical protein
MTKILVALLIALASGGASGCVHANATTAAPLPPLDVPPAPPRIVGTAEVEPLPPVGLVQEPARNLPPEAERTTLPPPKTESARPEVSKTEVPVEGPKPDETVKPVPAVTLQTTPAQQEGQLDARIRTQLTRATGDLSRVDYSRLNPNGRNQYDTAKGFIRQAEEALRMKNLVYANTLADKAVDLAAQLAGL